MANRVNVNVSLDLIKDAENSRRKTYFTCEGEDVKTQKIVYTVLCKNEYSVEENTFKTRAARTNFIKSSLSGYKAVNSAHILNTEAMNDMLANAPSDVLDQETINLAEAHLTQVHDFTWFSKVYNNRKAYFFIARTEENILEVRIFSPKIALTTFLNESANYLGDRVEIFNRG